MSVLVCDDHPLMRKALAATAQALAPGHSVHAASDFAQAWAVAEQEDEILLCIVDLHMPGAAPGEGLAGLKARAPEARIVVVTGSESDDELIEALKLGVDGFVPKSAEPGVVEAALQLVLAGGRYFPPRVADLIAADRGLLEGKQAPQQAAPVNFQGLYGRITERQRDVLKLLAQGRSNKEIANSLALSPATVKTHVASIIAVLGARNRTEAAAHARAGGMLE